MRTRFFRIIAALWLGSFVSTALAAPDIQQWWTPNGVRVLFVQDDILPMLDVRVLFDAASSRDDGLPGLAALTNGLLAEGAAGKSAQQIAEDFESVGAKIDNAALRDMAYVGVRTLTRERYLDRAMTTLAEVLTQPDFPPQAFERELARMKVARQASKQSPSDIAEEAFYKALYRDHPYATPVGGTDASLAAITLDDVRAFYRKYYVAGNALVVMVGAVDRAQAQTIATKLTAALPAGQKPASLPPVPELTEAKTIRIEFPSKQSNILVGQPGMTRGDPDYFALYVANHPLGGSGFSSRLVQTIREDRGLAYSVYSYFTPMREAGPFTMGMQTRADQTDEALSLMNTELEKYVSAGPTQAELDAAKSNITGSFPLGLDSNSKLLGYLAMIGFYDLPLDYIETFIDHVRAVDLKAVNDVLKRRLHPDRMLTVIVGKGAGEDAGESASARSQPAHESG